MPQGIVILAKIFIFNLALPVSRFAQSLFEEMGAWSEETFGNDRACDWVGEFLSDPSLVAVREAVELVCDNDDYLESDEAQDCLAACEVIARLQGKWGVRDSYSEDLDQWIEDNPTAVPEELKDLASAAIDRILGPESELQQLWDEGDGYEAWHAAVEGLRERVGG